MPVRRIILWQAALATSCCFLFIVRDAHRPARAQDVAAFNYAMCAPAGTLSCQSCFPGMLQMPGACQNSGNMVCGLYRSPPQGATYAMCQQAESTTETCVDTGTTIYRCTGGNFYNCGCAGWAYGVSAWSCNGLMCNGNCGGIPSYQNIWANMGNGCTD